MNITIEQKKQKAIEIKAECQARLNLIPYDGVVEIKEVLRDRR